MKDKDLLERARQGGINSCKPVVNLDDYSKNCEICGYDHEFKNGNNSVYYQLKHLKSDILDKWNKLNIVAVGSIGSSQGLLVRNPWGETDGMQVDKKSYKEFIDFLRDKP